MVNIHEKKLPYNSSISKYNLGLMEKDLTKQSFVQVGGSKKRRRTKRRRTKRRLTNGRRSKRRLTKYRRSRTSAKGGTPYLSQAQLRQGARAADDAADQGIAEHFAAQSEAGKVGQDAAEESERAAIAAQLAKLTRDEVEAVRSHMKKPSPEQQQSLRFLRGQADRAAGQPTSPKGLYSRLIRRLRLSKP